MFVVLYKKDIKDNTREWSIEVTQDAFIIVKTGIKGGKMIENILKIKSGKNKGKKNETSMYQQALNQANGKINKKIDQGYTKNETNEKIETKRPLPMLAHNFEKREKDIIFPCYIQPKLDGIRTIYDHENNKLYSRNNNDYFHFSEILSELHNVSLYLDGEIYTDEIPFEEFVGLSKKKKLSNIDKKNLDLLKLYVYDVIIPDKTYKERYEILKNLFKENNFKKIVLLETKICEDKSSADKFLEFYVEKGYEGLILRNLEGKYCINLRSKNLQKYKYFQDEEYEIIGAKTGTGREEGAIIWTCKTKEDKIFDVRPKGTIKSRKKIYKEYKKYIGKFLTVKFFRLTKDNIPLFSTFTSPELSLKCS